MSYLFFMRAAHRLQCSMHNLSDRLNFKLNAVPVRILMLQVITLTTPTFQKFQNKIVSANTKREEKKGFAGPCITFWKSYL